MKLTPNSHVRDVRPLEYRVDIDRVTSVPQSDPCPVRPIIPQLLSSTVEVNYFL